MSSCAKDYTVTSDKDLSAPFDSYKTYAWAKHIRTANSLAYVVNDAILKKRIQDAVAHELNARRINQSSNDPDLLVNYRVFDKPVEMTGYEGYFHDAEYWGTDEVRNNALGLIRRNTDDEGTKYYFDKGTLLVQLVDAEKGVVVWQGYASGLMDGNVFDKDEEHIAQAVNLIFDRFDYVLNE
ncbi:MAG: DUF4136 domain-containing protein [Bacteroidetes bacterium]|nr:DUF4136 domain-containing protein [Bacteroidota bacterium]